MDKGAGFGRTGRMHIFTYGSLMFRAVWSAVVDGTYRRCAGRIAGYHRRRISGEVYPALVPATPEEHVDGIVYLNVAPGDGRRLDRFEGAYYARTMTTCRLADGRRLSVFAYVIKPAFQHLVENRDWDPQWFQRHGLDAFTSTYGGFRRV